MNRPHDIRAGAPAPIVPRCTTAPGLLPSTASARVSTPSAPPRSDRAPRHAGRRRGDTRASGAIDLRAPRAATPLCVAGSRCKLRTQRTVVVRPG
jgi:hypothetical protein